MKKLNEYVSPEISIIEMTDVIMTSDIEPGDGGMGGDKPWG